MPEQDEELERLMLDILTIAGSVQYEEPTKAARRVRAFARRILHERQTAINGVLDEVIANLQAGGSEEVEMVRAMRARGR